MDTLASAPKKSNVGDNSGPVDVGSESQDETKNKTPTFGLKFLSFLKEWGGVATLLIALLYTFPFDAFSKFTDWRDKDLIEARAAINQLSELNVARALAMKQLKDEPPAMATIAESFNTRSYNIVVTRKAALFAAKARLSPGELYIVAGAQASGGLIADSLPFYEAAIRTSQKKDFNAYAGLNRSYGYALFSRSSAQNIDKGRSAYIESLKTLSNKSNFVDPGQYAANLSELGVWELVMGDWKCGTEELSAALQVWERMKVVNAYSAAAYAQVEEYWTKGAATKTRGANQPAAGCGKYDFPRIDWL